MGILDEIKKTFPSAFDEPSISDTYIEENQDIEMLHDIDPFKVVPVYMAWVVKNKDKALVDLYTINTLADLGRSKLKDNENFNFKYKCNKQQIDTIIKLLNWCQSNIYTADKKQINRSIRQWAK